MSLDVTLYDNKVQDAIKAISNSIAYLDIIPASVVDELKFARSKLKEVEKQELYSANITHNLNKMAMEAGIYEHLWRPDEINITRAGQLIEPLDTGYQLLLRHPARFSEFDSPNGWGLYEHFLPFVREYLQACVKWPDALVEVSR